MKKIFYTLLFLSFIINLNGQNLTGNNVTLTDPDPNLILNATSAGQYIDNNGTNQGWPRIKFRAYDALGGPLLDKWDLTYSARDNNFYFYNRTQSATQLHFEDSGDTFFPSGRLGIGIGTNTVPTATLQIKNPTSYNTVLEVGPAGDSHSYFRLDKHAGKDGGILFTEDRNLKYQLVNGTNGNFDIYSYSKSANVFSIQQTTGYLGLGTTTPGRELHINSATGSQIKLESTSNGAWSGLEWSANNGGFDAYSGILDNDGRYFVDVNSDGEDLTILQNGNLGVGTNSPNFRLDVNGQIGVKGQRLLDDNGSSLLMGDLAGGDGYRALTLRAGDQDRIYINTSGNVGIGTNGPTAKLDVNGTAIISGLTTLNNSLTISSNGHTTINNVTTLNNDVSINGTMTFGQTSSIPAAAISHYTNGYLYMKGGISGTIIADDGAINTVRIADGSNGYFMVETGDGTEKFRINSSGNVGIGTSSPQEKLAVDGSILAKKVRVSTAGADWPDYVFSPNFKLKTLSELETYIKTNKHLPEVPSAKEVEKEGLDLGKMDATLLKKVEELTLYLIEVNKNQEKLIKEVEELKKENEKLKGNK